MSRACALLLLLAALGGGCSVADNLSGPEIVGEIDRIIRVEGPGGDRRVAYRDEAEVSAWYMRFWLFAPVRSLLGAAFGPVRKDRLDRPMAHVRVLATELRDELDADLARGAGAARVLGTLAEFERNMHLRIVALDGLATLVQRLRIPVFQAPFESLGLAADPAAFAAARLATQVGRPGVRRGVDTPFVAGAYAEALATLAQAPLADASERIALVEELAELLTSETDATARAAAAAALRQAIRHVVEGALLRTVQLRGSETVELRLCVMEQIRRLGGPATVPLLLAAMAATPEQQRAGVPRYDEDGSIPLVQLRLIHYAGQLSGPLATTAVQLPGRKDEVALSPAEFLATTVLNETAYYSKLGTPALVALTWSLRRPKLELDAAWVAAWRQQNRR